MTAPQHDAPPDRRVTVIATDLEKPDLDDRSYRIIQLTNKLEALIVHDPDTDKSSAALDVHVGNFSDSEDLQGQAHAVEHLLFMGTEKYPKENDYSQYLAEHSGFSNAYTASTSTNYYFEVGHEHFHGALDRFAQFFIAPLFLAETLDRELRAVDSENKKNLQNDTWRLYQLSKTLSNKEHPFHHFSTGNLQTLKEEPEKRGINVRDEFMKFHEKYYSANRMKLVVLGREPLETLENWVVELFEGVKNKDLPDPEFKGQPLTQEHLGKFIFAKPVMDTRQIDIVFPFLDEEDYFLSHPSRYAGHLIGHEGPGSVLAYLKKKGWANSLSTGASPIARGSAFYTVNIKLTEDGLDHYEEIIAVVFRYINLVKDTPIQKWIVEEMQKTAAVDFKFRQKSRAHKFTSRNAAVMQRPLPREMLLSANALIKEYDEGLIQKSLEYLRPDNCRVQITARTCPHGEFNQTEKWYGTEYRIENFPERFIQALAETIGKGKGAGDLNGELHLPHKNEFIPTNFEVQKKKVDTPVKVPALIKNTELSRIWFKKDDTFWVPKANVFLKLRNHLPNSTPANAVIARIYCELVKDALNEYAYDAELAGLEYGVSSGSMGMEIEISGYNDKMSVLLEKVVTTMKNLEILPDRFRVIKEKSLKAYKNWELQQPYNQVGEFVRFMNSERMWLNEDLLAELERLTLEDVKNLYPKFFTQTHIEALVHGNLYKEDALQYVNLVESILKPSPLPPTQFVIRRSLVFPEGGNFIWSRPLKDPKNVNSVIEYTLYVGEQTDKLLMNKLTLFSQLTDEPCFDQLRTKEQLGYIVWSGNRYSATTMAFRVILQSERSAPYLESRIDEFLRSFRQRLVDMSEKDFNSHVRAVILRKTEKLKNLTQESNRLWIYIAGEVYEFEQLDLDVQIMQKITKEDMVEFYDQYISPESPSRAKVSVQMHATDTTVEARKPAIVETLIQFLSAAAGVVSEPAEIGKLLEKADIHDTDAVIASVKGFLKDTKGIDVNTIDTIIEKGREAINQAIPKKVDSDDALSSNNSGVVMKEVEEVVAWKAGCRVTAGPLPVKPLVEFADTEVKL